MTLAFSEHPKGRRPLFSWTRLLLATIALLGALAIGFLISEIVEELRYLSSASSDNVHWVLSQAEVEFLEFSNAIESARREATPAALEHLIIEFDVFYSRMTTLGTGALYADMRGIDAFGQAVTEIRARLEAMVPLIDGPDDALRTGLAGLGVQAEEIRPLLRQVATTGLQFFAERSDQSRVSVLDTLLRLAGITLTLVLALIVMLVYTRRVSNQTVKRGKELSEAYTRLNTILQTSLDAVLVSDLDGRILSFNPAAERIFRISRNQAIGKNLADIMIPPKQRPAHAAGMERMRARGEYKVVGAGRIRLEAQRMTGEVFPVEMALEKAQSGDDEVIVGFMRDISHRVAAETELVEARDKALAGEKAKAEFLAMMTHEIRTPLNGLLGNLALLSKTKLSEPQGRYVRNMDISGEMLMHHVDAVLDVARFESGATEPKEEVVHIGRLIQDIVDSQASAAEARGNHIQWGWSDAPLDWVRVDASRLSQVLLNLVGNAIKFTRDGRILIEAEQTGRAGLEIRVIDSGIGISEEDQKLVFNDFATLDLPHSESQSGTGLGLGIARRFVEAMGGEIGVESSVGEGSVFWFRLPLEAAVEPDETPESTRPDAAEAAARPVDILLVEDNDINRELACEMLIGLGHRVATACDGEEAVTAANARRFDLILMDIRMPRLDGLAATRRIRAGEGASRDVPIIAFSANVLPEARGRFTEAGMSGFLPKPLNEDELRQVIERFGGGRPAPAPAKPAQQAEESRPENPLDRLRLRYLEETRDLFAWLEGAPKDMGEIADRAHQVAGSAAAFGQSDLRDALVFVETAAEHGDGEVLEQAIRDARAAWVRAPEPSLG